MAPNKWNEPDDEISLAFCHKTLALIVWAINLWWKESASKKSNNSLNPEDFAFVR